MQEQLPVQPAFVGWNVGDVPQGQAARSVTHTGLGCWVLKSCFSRFSATGKAWFEFVVALNLRVCLQRIPRCLRKRLMRPTPA